MTSEAISFELRTDESDTDRNKRYQRLHQERVTSGVPYPEGVTTESLGLARAIKEAIGSVPILVVSALAEVDSVYLRLLVNDALNEEDIAEEPIARLAKAMELDMNSLPRPKSWD